MGTWASRATTFTSSQAMPQSQFLTIQQCLERVASRLRPSNFGGALKKLSNPEVDIQIKFTKAAILIRARAASKPPGKVEMLQA